MESFKFNFLGIEKQSNGILGQLPARKEGIAEYTLAKKRVLVKFNRKPRSIVYLDKRIEITINENHREITKNVEFKDLGVNFHNIYYDYLRNIIVILYDI